MSELIDIPSLIIQSVNLAIIIFVLRRFLFIPYMQYLDQEAAARKLLIEQTKEGEAILTQARDQAEQIVDRSRLDAKMVASEITEQARREAMDIRSHAEKDAENTRSKGFSEIALERKKLYEEMKSRVMEVALALNKKLFGDSSSHREFLEKNAQEVKF